MQRTINNKSASLTLVGLGPGSFELLSPLACQALKQADCLVGYTRYIALIPKELSQNKEIFTSGMRQEITRVQYAIDTVCTGKSVALVASGDPGIYALSGLVLELLEAQQILPKVPLTIIPGIPAIAAAASLLGAPLMHDFACISLSDLLTPWEKIEKRLRCAAMADFVIGIYNPRSMGRPDHLTKALSLIGEYRSPTCPVGIVTNAYREKQKVAIYPLGLVPVEEVSMLSILLCGNSETRMCSTYMLTPRGYAVKRKQ